MQGIKNIEVYPNPHADFAIRPEKVKLPDDPIYTTNLSINADSYLWEFGDGTTSTEESPDHTYADAGWKTVKLTGTSEGGVSASFETTFEIHDPVEAGFEYTVDGFTVHLTDTSVNAAALMWDFGDGSTSNLRDPEHMFSNTGSMDSVYTVKLLALAPNNICTDSFFMDITVHPYVHASFTVPDHLGCTPFEATFENSSIGIPLALNAPEELSIGSGTSPSGKTNPEPGSYDTMARTLGFLRAVDHPNPPE